MNISAGCGFALGAGSRRSMDGAVAQERTREASFDKTKIPGQWPTTFRTRTRVARMNHPQSSTPLIQSSTATSCLFSTHYQYNSACIRSVIDTPQNLGKRPHSTIDFWPCRAATCKSFTSKFFHLLVFGAKARHARNRASVSTRLILAQEPLSLNQALMGGGLSNIAGFMILRVDPCEWAGI